MKVLLMHPDRDFDLEPVIPPQLAWLRPDLQLEPIVAAMANGNRLLAQVATVALLGGTTNDEATIRYRQAILADAQAHPSVFRELFALADRAAADRRVKAHGLLENWPVAILNRAIESLEVYANHLTTLRTILSRADFRSAGMTGLVNLVTTELSDDYLRALRGHLRALRPGGGVLASAQLGWGNQGTNYTLRRERGGSGPQEGWLTRTLGRNPSGSAVRVDDRDEVESRALSDLKDKAINRVATVMAHSADQIGAFFELLRFEIGFYVGSLNLADALGARGLPTCQPELGPPQWRLPGFTGLVDIGLGLATRITLVPNSITAHGQQAIVITGANQGGKSTFLRSLGQAQLMMQAGLFVAAQEFRGAPCNGIFTHFTREEDASMRSGRLDDELARLSSLVDLVSPGSLLLLNESLSSTNEREGSQLADQIVTALTASGVLVVYVTHLYEFAKGQQGRPGVLLLRAPRNPDGTRSFALAPGAPESSSFGADLYDQVFGASDPLGPSPAPESSGPGAPES